MSNESQLRFAITLSRAVALWKLFPSKWKQNFCTAAKTSDASRTRATTQFRNFDSHATVLR